MHLQVLRQFVEVKPMPLDLIVSYLLTTVQIHHFTMLLSFVCLFQEERCWRWHLNEPNILTALLHSKIASLQMDIKFGEVGRHSAAKKKSTYFRISDFGMNQQRDLSSRYGLSTALQDKICREKAKKVKPPHLPVRAMEQGAELQAAAVVPADELGDVVLEGRAHERRHLPPLSGLLQA